MLDIDDVKEHVRRFNNREEWVLGDNLVREIFSAELYEVKVIERVCVLNTMWKTNLPDKEIILVGRKLYNEYFQTNEWNDIKEMIVNVKINGGLRETNEEIRQNLCDSMFNKVLEILREVTGERKYVFSAKFCHWIAPEVFPIIDRRNARPVIHQEQIRENFEENELITEITDNFNIDDSVHDYKKLINFYAKELQNLEQTIINKLILFDYTTQSENYKHINTILRILDKYFWLKGREHGENRI